MIGEKRNAIIEYLIKLNCPIINLLQSPLENEEFDKLMVDLPISLPNEVISLFKWRNGVDANKENYVGTAKLFPRAAFYEFSHTINRYKEGAEFFFNFNGWSSLIICFMGCIKSIPVIMIRVLNQFLLVSLAAFLA